MPRRFARGLCLLLEPFLFPLSLLLFREPFGEMDGENQHCTVASPVAQRRAHTKRWARLEVQVTRDDTLRKTEHLLELMAGRKIVAQQCDGGWQ